MTNDKLEKLEKLEKMKIWILTSEHNAYDQYGYYHLGWFQKKPTFNELQKIMKKLKETHNNSLVEHLLEFGKCDTKIRCGGEVSYQLEEHESLN